MRFRFSMKWLLGAMLYVALAAAAFGGENWLFADLLWIASFAAFAFAVLLVCFARGTRQATAAGFAVLWLCFAGCLYLVPYDVPTSRVLFVIYASEASGQLQGDRARLSSVDFERIMRNQGVPLIRDEGVPPPPPRTQVLRTRIYGDALRLRAANAVGSMAAGLLGCLLGYLAYQRRPTTPATGVGA